MKGMLVSSFCLNVVVAQKDITFSWRRPAEFHSSAVYSPGGRSIPVNLAGNAH